MSLGLRFTKYQAAGNDFILMDARDPATRQKILSLSRAEIAKICDRRFGIGADGLILLLAHPDYDFEMKNYNSDGGECSMCGNGGRSLVHFAQALGLNKKDYRFLATDGPHEAKIEGSLVHLKMQDVPSVVPTPLGATFNTGSPHLIRKVNQLMAIDVVSEGRMIRNSPLFMPGGINVNFIEEIDGQLFIRTYERGVEDETLSCGTGVIAAALTMNEAKGFTSIQARGGMLSVKFEKNGSGFKDIWLIGPAEKTFEGTIN